MSSSCADSSSTQWMLSSGGESPCAVLESVIKSCSSSANVPNLNVDVSCATLGINATSPCCCSTVTYALVSGCWVCQWNRPSSLLSSTYQSWLSGCPVESRLNGSLPSVVISSNPPIPTWALVRPGIGDATWNETSARLAVGISPNSSPSVSPESKPPRTLYITISICAVVVLLLILGMAGWLYRRRNRVSPSSRPPPDFEIDGGATSGLLPKDNPRPGWSWWSKVSGSSSRQSVSDPGKIDAWRYPFDYEPVSTTSSSGQYSTNGQYYDPHRPRRNSDMHRNSMDTLGVRGQGSMQNLTHGRATPSPVPGHTPIQTYSALPQHPTYGQPPTYNYTYPYAQPVPSTSTTSPLSPAYVQSPTRTVHQPRRAEHMVMIPVDQLSPDQLQQFRQFPGFQIKQKKRRRRRREGEETDRERERGRARAATDADQFVSPGATRPRSMSVPVQPETDEEWDGRPRNGVELREKYERRRDRGVVTITVGEGVVVRQGTSGGNRPGSGGNRPSSGGTKPDGGGDGRRNSRVRGPRERSRAQDGGVSLMGGPPPPIR